MSVVANIVLRNTHPLRRMAPSIVKFGPQFIGVRSMYSVPFLTQAWLRVMARFSPASSMKTSRSTGIERTSRQKASRFATTSGRSCSSGRTRFFSPRSLRDAARA